jgi:hypothetical protein
MALFDQTAEPQAGQTDFDSAHYVTDYRSFFFSDYEGFWESPVQVYEEEVRVVLWQA